MKKIIILNIMLYIILTLFSQTTFHICLSDSLESYTTLYPGTTFTGFLYALTTCVDGDTIVVYPGRYRSVHMDFEGKNIYMTSRYKYTNDRNDIYNTVFDGLNSSGSLFSFISNETRGAVINGFTIRNGNGTQIMPSSDPYLREGGGIRIVNSSPTIINCVIENNSASTRGGGISITSTQISTSPYLAGNVIKNNSSEGLGGGLYIGGYQAQAIFDTINKNSVFLNSAIEHRDISSATQSYISVVLDTFSVATDDPYYINMSAPYDFTCNFWVSEQIDQDIFVSASGNDTNSGLTQNDPLKTINEAMFRIRSNHNTRNTIHVAPGVYKASEGQIFPMKMKADVILQGTGQGETVIDLEHNAGAIHSFTGAKNFRISSITFRNNWAEAEPTPQKAPIVLTNTTDCEISDCLFENNLYGIYAYDGNNHSLQPEPIRLKNLSFISNYSHVLDLYLANATLENIKIMNNSFDTIGGSTPNFSGTPIRINSNQRMRANYTLSNILIASTLDFEVVYSINTPGPSAVEIGSNMDVLLNNATIANSFPVSNNEPVNPKDMIWIGQGSEVRTFNSIFWNNYSNIIRVTGGTFHLNNSLLEGGPSMIIGSSVWGEGNIEVYPNFDWGCPDVEDWPYQLMATSPCVDAGTTNIPNHSWSTGDLQGSTRILGETVDMGAYEFNGSSEAYADFIGTPRTGEVPLTVQFSDTSVGLGITSWQWDFNDDGIIDSTEQNPTFTYYTIGQPTVKLVVNDGQNTVIKPVYINPLSATITGGGTIQGVVTSNGYPLPGVLVIIVGTTLNTTTNEWGFYTIADIVAGVYSIRAMKADYETYSHEDVVISANQATTHNFMLTPTSESDITVAQRETKLIGNYPNPFNPETTIAFTLASAGNVEIEIYNIKGHKVKNLLGEHRNAGNHQIIWDGTDDRNCIVGSGVYFYRLKSNGNISTKKMLLLK